MAMDADGRTRTITRDVVQKITVDMRRLAETRKTDDGIPRLVTRPQVVRALRREIGAVLKQGYDIEDIIALLGQHGIEIDPVTFRRYWRRAKASYVRPRSEKSVQSPASN